MPKVDFFKVPKVHSFKILAPTDQKKNYTPTQRLSLLSLGSCHTYPSSAELDIVIVSWFDSTRFWRGGKSLVNSHVYPSLLRVSNSRQHILKPDPIFHLVFDFKSQNFYFPAPWYKCLWRFAAFFRRLWQHLTPRLIRDRLWFWKILLLRYEISLIWFDLSVILTFGQSQVYQSVPIALIHSILLIFYCSEFLFRGVSQKCYITICNILSFGDSFVWVKIWCCRCAQVSASDVSRKCMPARPVRLSPWHVPCESGRHSMSTTTLSLAPESVGAVVPRTLQESGTVVERIHPDVSAPSTR